jgi:hypothetical protein
MKILKMLRGRTSRIEVTHFCARCRGEYNIAFLDYCPTCSVPAEGLWQNLRPIPKESARLTLGDLCSEEFNEAVDEIRKREDQQWLDNIISTERK